MQFQVVSPGPMVKKLLIANIAIWVLVNIVLEKIFIGAPIVTVYLGFIPELVVESFYIWQPLTYMFLHANFTHVLFNMISLWFFGSELEERWGSRSFLTFYLVTGVGAAFIYLIGMLLAGLIKGAEPTGYAVPVVGASGAIYGILLAYGVLFSERMVYFFGILPLKAKHFVLLLGGIEMMMLMGSSAENNVANLAHLGGIITGALYLFLWTQYRQKWSKRAPKRAGARRNLRLVVNKKDNDPGDGPKYWN